MQAHTLVSDLFGDVTNPMLVFRYNFEVDISSTASAHNVSSIIIIIQIVCNICSVSKID